MYRIDQLKKKHRIFVRAVSDPHYQGPLEKTNEREVSARELLLRLLTLTL